MTETVADWQHLSDDELLVRLRQRGTPSPVAVMFVKRRDQDQYRLDISDVLDRGW